MHTFFNTFFILQRGKGAGLICTSLTPPPPSTRVNVIAEHSKSPLLRPPPPLPWQKRGKAPQSLEPASMNTATAGKAAEMICHCVNPRSRTYSGRGRKPPSKGQGGITGDERR